MKKTSYQQHGRNAFWVRVALLAATALPATAAQAQGDPQGASTSNQDIIVTARKQEERVSDVPIAIEVLSSKEIQRYATQSFAGLSNQVAGLSIGNSSSPGTVVINLRGIGSGTSSATLDQAVSVNLDGLQVSQANLLQLGFYDMERVEVLKGPQALFYGKNSPGGVVSLVSANPGEDLEARVKAGYEFYARQKFIEAMVSAPLADGLGLRVVGYASDTDGWFKNVSPQAAHSRFPGKKTYFTRGTLRYAPGTGFDNTLKVSYSRGKQNIGVSSNGQLYNCPLGHGVFDVAPFTPCKLDRIADSGPISPASLAFDPRFKRNSYYNQWQFAAINSANVDVGDELTLSSVTTYYKGLDDFNDNCCAHELDIIPANIQKRFKQFTQEVRATSSYDGPVNFMAGAFYQKGKYAENNALLLNFGTPILLGDERYTQTTKAYSVFGQLMFQITPKLDFNIGGRYSHETKSVTAVSFQDSVFNPAGPLPFAKPKSSFNNFSPEMTLRFKPTEASMLYATYRHGFVSGGYNLTSAAARLPYNQEKVKGGEIGAKAAFFDRQLRFDIAAYHYKYKGLQLSAFDSDALSYTVTNAAGAKSYGVDLSLEFQPRAVRGLTLRGSVAWNHARYGDFRGAPCYVGQSFSGGCNLNPIDGVGQAQDLSGERLARAADWAGNIGATYEAEISADHVISLSADGAYKSSYSPLLEADPVARQKSSWILNATAGVRSVDNSWEVALIGRNLTNTLRITESNAAGLTGGGTGTSTPTRPDLLGQVSEPRAVMLQVTLRDSLLRK